MGKREEPAPRPVFYYEETGVRKMKVLVVVDMQKDFVDGSLGTKEAVAIVPNVVDKILKFDGDVIAVTQDTHHDNYMETQEGKKLPVMHCIKGSEGWMLAPAITAALSTQTGMVVMDFFNKETFGSVEMCEWLSELNAEEESIDEIEVVGLCTDICVVSNVLMMKAYMPEVPIIVDVSCCAGVTPESHAAAIKTMKACQINVIGE